MIDPQALKDIIAYVACNYRRTVLVMLLLLISFAAYQFVLTFVPLYATHLVADSVEKATVSYTQINAVLVSLRDEGHTSRTLLYRFHDSKKDILGTDFFFVSETSAVVAPGVSLDVAAMQNVPASGYIDQVHGTSILNELINHRSIHFSMDELPNGYLSATLAKRGTRYAVWTGIYDLSNNLVGMLAEGWLRPEDVPQGKAMDEHLEHLRQAADRISGYLLQRIK